MRPASFDFNSASAGALTGEYELEPLRLNILIPISGEGRRFQKAGFVMPKPLIDIGGKPMIQRVIENIALAGNYIFIVRREHEECWKIRSILDRLCKGKIVMADSLTEGAACSTLLAKELINNDRPLIIANGDQLVDWEPESFLQAMRDSEADGGILTFEADDPKWSFVRIDGGRICEVAEKRVVSNMATVGIYYYRRGSDYVRHAESMIAKNIRVNGEFYVAPVFNEFIESGQTVLPYRCKKMHGLGTPEDLADYLHEICALPVGSATAV